jgi:ferredoxin-fold anticodon binding domain-containing protein
MANGGLEDLFKEFMLMYKVINRKKIIDILRTELSSEQFIEIYQKSNGEKSTRDISAILKNACSHSTIARLWNKWALLGLVVPVKQKGRYKAAFDLDEYGISGVIEEEESN